MKTIIKKAWQMAKILGVDERSVTNRVASIRRAEHALNKQVSTGNITKQEVEDHLKALRQTQLKGYNYQIDGVGQRPGYTFFKNVAS